MDKVSANLWVGASTEQENIIHSKGSVCVSACPGSGKTWTAARMFINRSLNKINHRRGIAFISHTNIAVEEFIRQVKEINKSIDVNQFNFIGTIDSFVEKFVISPFFYIFPRLTKRPYCTTFNDSNYAFKLRTEDKYPISINDIQCSYSDSCRVYTARDRYNKVILDSSNVESVFAQALYTCGIYSHEMRWYIVDVILQNENILRCIANRFSDIIIDEAQDTRDVAFYIINKLKRAATIELNISLIGDINQSIYSFTGASIATYLSAINMWRLTPLSLTENRRSFSGVTDGVKSLFGIKMTPVEADLGGGIFYLSKSEYERIDKEKIANYFNILPQNVKILSRHKPYRKVNITSYVNNLFEVCKQRDFFNDPLSAYRELVKFVKSTNNHFQVETGKFIPQIWNILMNKELVPSLNFPWTRWREKMIAGLKQLEIDLGIDDIRISRLRKPKLILEDIHINQQISVGDERQTVHSVKGETYDGVIFSDDDFVWAKLAKHKPNDGVIDDEELRIIYVAITRARKFALLVLPDAHLDKYSSLWNRKLPKFSLN